MGKRGVTPLHTGRRVGDEGGEVVGVDRGDDGPLWQGAREGLD